MSKDMEIMDSMKAKDVPPSKRGVRRDYKPILKSVATLEKGEAIQVRVRKKHVASGIKNALKRAYKKQHFKVTTRAVEGEKHKRDVYIIRK